MVDAPTCEMPNFSGSWRAATGSTLSSPMMVGKGFRRHVLERRAARSPLQASTGRRLLGSGPQRRARPRPSTIRRACVRCLPRQELTPGLCSACVRCWGCLRRAMWHIMGLHQFLKIAQWKLYVCWGYRLPSRSNKAHHVPALTSLGGTLSYPVRYPKYFMRL